MDRKGLSLRALHMNSLELSDIINEFAHERQGV